MSRYRPVGPCLVEPRDIGQSPAHSAVCESEEETGILAEVTGFLGVCSNPDTSSSTPTARSGNRTRPFTSVAPSEESPASTMKRRREMGPGGPAHTRDPPEYARTAGHCPAGTYPYLG